MQEEENGEAKAEASDAKPAAPAASPGAPVLEEGVNPCFAVVSSAVRKGKGRGKGVAWAAGGYVPAHLRDPAEEPEQQPSPAEGGAADEGAASPDAAAASAAPAAAATPADASLGMAASFDSVGLSTSGSFDGEVGEGGSVRKRAKRWQRRASASMVDLPAGDAGSAGSGGATASANAGAKGPSPGEEEQSAKRPKVSPPPSPVVNDGGGDLPIGSPAPSGTASPVPPADPPADGGTAASAPPAAAPDYGLPPPSPWPTGPATLDKLPASKLKLLARYHGVNITGCLEKAEMVAALRKAGLGDEAAEKMMERERGAAEPTQAEPLDPRTELQKENERKAKEHAAKRQAAALAEAQERAAAAEAEAKRLREELEASKTSSRKKWAPAFMSTPFIPEEEKRQDPLSLQRNPSFGFGNSRPPFGAPMARPEGGVDMRGKSQGKGAEFDICWEFKNNRCSKGKMCKWRHS